MGKIGRILVAIGLACALWAPPAWSRDVDLALILAIDVSGDGVNNQGRPINDARDQVLAQGIIINGLPILSDYEFLDSYYEEHVIGGAGAFMEVVKDYSSFGKAVLSKLVREIAGNDVRARTILVRPSLAEPVQAAQAARSGLKQTQPDFTVIDTGLRLLPAQGPARQ